MLILFLLLLFVFFCVYLDVGSIGLVFFDFFLKNFKLGMGMVNVEDIFVLSIVLVCLFIFFDFIFFFLEYLDLGCVVEFW